MATQKQTDANRRNSQSSTGPRTAEGKSASRMNALKTGIDAKSQIIRGESLAALESLTAEYYARFNPATPEQRFLVDTLVNSEWLLRRLRAVEAQIWERDFADTEQSGYYKMKTALGLTFVREHETFLHLQRRIDSADRAYHRALRILQRLQSPPSKEAVRPQHRKPSFDPPVLPVFSPSDVQENDRPQTQIGFVPSNPRIPPTPASATSDPAARRRNFDAGFEWGGPHGRAF